MAKKLIKMKRKFLNAKHWQLFALTIGLLLLIQFIGFATAILSFTSNNSNVMEFINTLSYVFYGGLLIVVIVLFGWIWSIADLFQKKLPTNLKMNLGEFKIIVIT